MRAYVRLKLFKNLRGKQWGEKIKIYPERRSNTNRKKIIFRHTNGVDKNQLIFQYFLYSHFFPIKSKAMRRVLQLFYESVVNKKLFGPLLNGIWREVDVSLVRVEDIRWRARNPVESYIQRSKQKIVR